MLISNVSRRFAKSLQEMEITAPRVAVNTPPRRRVSCSSAKMSADRYFCCEPTLSIETLAAPNGPSVSRKPDGKAAASLAHVQRCVSSQLLCWDEIPQAGSWKDLL